MAKTPIENRRHTFKQHKSLYKKIKPLFHNHIKFVVYTYTEYAKYHAHNLSHHQITQILKQSPALQLQHHYDVILK